MSCRIVISVAFLIFISAGCADLPVQPLRICPGVESAAEAVAVLDARPLNAVSFKASGRCRLKYHEDGREKNENFAVKLWMNPPSEIYMQGDVGFDPKGLVLGCNERDFWLALKPKEISSYWWGRWASNDAYESILINPKLILEAAGIGQMICHEQWDLSRRGNFDVVTCQTRGGVASKKIHISACDKQIQKIEYYEAGTLAAIVELYQYRKVSEQFSVPAVIRIIQGQKGKERRYAEIRFNSVSQIELAGGQRQLMFSRPKPFGFEHVYQIAGERVIKQSDY